MASSSGGLEISAMRMSGGTISLRRSFIVPMRAEMFEDDDSDLKYAPHTDLTLGTLQEVEEGYGGASEYVQSQKTSVTFSIKGNAKGSQLALAEYGQDEDYKSNHDDEKGPEEDAQFSAGEEVDSDGGRYGGSMDNSRGPYGSHRNEAAVWDESSLV